MPRSKDKPTGSFVFKNIKLDLSNEQRKFWDNRFHILTLMINKIIYEVTQMCEEYNEAVKDGIEHYRNNDKDKAKQIFEDNKHLRPAYRKKELRELRNTKLQRYASNVPAQVFNYEVSRIVKYAETHLIFSKKSKQQKKFTKKLQYLHRRNELYIMTSGNTQTLKFKVDELGNIAQFKYGKHVFKIKLGDANNKERIESLNQYVQNDLITEIKIQRNKSNKGWNYYLICTIAGESKTKNITSEVKYKEEYTKAKGLVAIDINLNQIDIRKCDTGEEFSMEYYNQAIYHKYNDKLLKLQQKLSKLYRLHNPDCYNDNGTGIKGKKCKVITNRMKYLHNSIQALRDKFYTWRKQEYNKLCNFIRSCGDELIIEKNGIDGWRRKKKTSKKMRVAVQQNAPGLFSAQLKNKFDEIHELDTYKTKCSITCSNCGRINRLKGNIYHCSGCELTINRHVNAIRTMEKVIRPTDSVSKVVGVVQAPVYEDRGHIPKECR